MTEFNIISSIFVLVFLYINSSGFCLPAMRRIGNEVA